MSLRDWFAGKFIQTLKVSSGRIYFHAYGEATHDPDEIAEGLYRMADAMVKVSVRRSTKGDD